MTVPHLICRSRQSFEEGLPQLAMPLLCAAQRVFDPGQVLRRHGRRPGVSTAPGTCCSVARHLLLTLIKSTQSGVDLQAAQIRSMESAVHCIVHCTPQRSLTTGPVHPT